MLKMSDPPDQQILRLIEGELVLLPQLKTYLNSHQERDRSSRRGAVVKESD